MPKKQDDTKSTFRLFWSSITFTDEPLWYRVVIIVLTLVALVAIVYILKEWVSVPVVGSQAGKVKDAIGLLASKKI